MAIRKDKRSPHPLLADLGLTRSAEPWARPSIPGRRAVTPDVRGRLHPGPRTALGPGITMTNSASSRLLPKNHQCRSVRPRRGARSNA